MTALTTKRTSKKSPSPSKRYYGFEWFFDEIGNPLGEWETKNGRDYYPVVSWLRRNEENISTAIGAIILGSFIGMVLALVIYGGGR